MLKKILKISAILLVVLLLLAFSLPFFFRDKITALARDQINKHINTKVDFSDVDLSMFRHFPRLSVGLNNLQVIGADDFNKDTLISAAQVDVALNLFSLFGGYQIDIYSISIDKPRIHAIVNKDGKANWDISKPDTSGSSTNTGSNFRMHLQSYKVNEGYISYTDVPSDMYCEIQNLNHSGAGDFTSDLFTLQTKTSIESVSFTRNRIPWLVNTRAALTADFEVDNRSKKYSFKTDGIYLNDLQVATEGFFQFVNDTTYGMDIQFHTPSTAFKTLLSLVPSIYQTDFDKIKTGGSVRFNGNIKGEYNSKKIPAYLVDLTVENGFFQYPDLPQPVKNIGIAMKVQNPDGVPDHTELNISKGHIEFGNDPFDFRMLLKNPLTTQYIDAAVKGKLNFAEVTRFVKLTAGTGLSGLLDANASAKGNLATITKQQAGPFTANGFIHLTELNYNSAVFPQPIRNGNIQIAFQNKDGLADHTLVQVPVAHIEIGSDPVDFNLSLKTPVSNPVFEGYVKGSFNLANTKQFTALPSGTSITGTIAGNLTFAGNKTSVDRKQYDKIKTSGSLSLDNINYISSDYPDGIQVSDANFSFNPKNITLHSAHGSYLKSRFTASGSLDNVIAYILKDESLDGNISLYADQIDLNAFMHSTQKYADSNKNKIAQSPFPVPKNLSFLIQMRADKMHYDKVDYSNLTGAIAIHDEVVAMKDIQMDALDGKLKASGYYSTKSDKKNPDISFTYEVSGLDIQKTFYAFITVQKLMPIGKFVDGRMNSKLSLNGKLNGDMSPDMNSLTGNGNLAMIDGVFNGFAPVEKLSQTLHMAQINNLSLKDVNLSFEFAKGRVLVKPFKEKVNNIDMEIGGTHGFDQSIDYVIAMKVPRSQMGNDANKLVNNLVQQVNNKGVPVKLNDYINLKVNMVGTLTNPQIKMGMNNPGTDASYEIKQQAAEFSKQVADSVKTVVSIKSNEVKDSAVAVKNQAIKDLQKDMGKSVSGQKDSTGTQALANTQKNAEKTVKNTFDNLFNKKKPAKE